MINQVATNTNSNAFAPLRSNVAPYAIAKPLQNSQKQDAEKKNEKKINKFGLSIGVLSLLTGLGLFVFLKKLPKGLVNKVETAGRKFENKAIELKKNNQSLTVAQNIYFHALKVIKPIFRGLKSIFTIANLKDILVKKALEFVPPLSKLGDQITERFEKVSVWMSRHKYIKTFSRSEKMFVEFADANKILKDPVRARELQSRIERVRELYHKGFSETARTDRYERSKLAMDKGKGDGKYKDLADRFWGETLAHPFTFFKSPKTYSSFIAEGMVKEPKSALHEEVAALRVAFSTGFMDNYRDVAFNLKKLASYSDPTDADLRKLVREAKDELRKSFKKGEFDNTSRRTLLEKFNQMSPKFDNIENGEIRKELLDRIRHSISVLSENKEGELQKIMREYKALLPKEDYAKLEKSVNRYLDSLHVSIDTETDKLFDKVRDLKIGSAPKDTLAVLASVGVVGWGLSKSKNNDERVSVSLKYGIPAVGGVLTALYCTLALMPAGPSLFIGLISGLIMNKLGEATDNARKGYNKDKDTVSLSDVKSIDISPTKLIKNIEESGASSEDDKKQDKPKKSS